MKIQLDFPIRYRTIDVVGTKYYITLSTHIIKKYRFLSINILGFGFTYIGNV